MGLWSNGGNCLNLHALSAAASAGFIAMFAMVNVTSVNFNAIKGGHRWISVIGTLACGVALLVLLLQIGRVAEKEVECVRLSAGRVGC